MQPHQWQQISEFAELSGPVDGCHAWAMTDEWWMHKRPPNFTNIMPNRRFRAALKAVVYCTIWRSNESGIGFVCPLWGTWQLSTMARVARECPILIDRRTAQRSLKRQALSEAGIGGRAKGRRRWRNSKSDSARDCVENTAKPSNHYVHLTPREQFWGVTSVKRRWGCSRQLKEVDSFRFAMRKFTRTLVVGRWDAAWELERAHQEFGAVEGIHLLQLPPPLLLDCYFSMPNPEQISNCLEFSTSSFFPPRRASWPWP